MSSRWLDAGELLDAYVDWLQDVLGEAATAVANTAPEHLTGPTAVVSLLAAPRTGQPLVGLTGAVLRLQVLSVGWDAESGRSVPDQAIRLDEQIRKATAGTASDGTYLTEMNLDGYRVLRRTTADDNALGHVRGLWQSPAIVELHVVTV